MFRLLHLQTEADDQSGFASRDDEMKFVALMSAGLISAGAALLSVPAQAAPGMGNPAAAYCGSIGGKSFVRKTSAGEVGYCRLRNGQVREEWALFRASQKRSPKRRSNGHLGNPAATYCEKQKGTIEVRPDANYCHLPDGRVVEEWELFREQPAGRAR